MLESHEYDEMQDEYRGKNRNQSFSRLKEFVEDYMLTHSELVTKINLAAQNYDGYDFTKDINDLLRESI